MKTSLQPLHESVNDEVAAYFVQAMENAELISLQGVEVWFGNHPDRGRSLVVSPAAGSHLIVQFPFAGESNND